MAGGEAGGDRGEVEGGRVTLILRICGYRRFRAQIVFNDYSSFESWHWMKSARAHELPMPVIGSRWIDKFVIGYRMDREDCI